MDPRELNPGAAGSRADGWRSSDGFALLAQPERQQEDDEFKRNARVTSNGQVVTGYGSVAVLEDSDGTVHEHEVDPGPPPDRLERDRGRAHALRSRVRNQRLLVARSHAQAGCFGQRRRLPQARRPRPAARRSTVSSRDGPGGDDPHQPSSDDDPPRRALVPRRWWRDWALRRLRSLRRLLEAAAS